MRAAHLAHPEIGDMSYTNAKPAAAKALLEGPEAWIYLDVRTPEEFRAGHVKGAYNVPFALRDRAGRMTPNADFASVVRRHFPLETKLVIGCASGVRSVYACQILEAEGYSSLVNMECGFSGTRGPTGAVEAGWQASGYPCEVSGPAERTFERLAERK